MKSLPRTLRIAILLSAAFSLSAQPAKTSVAPANKIELFDGKSFSGWTFVSQGTNAPAASIWSVTNGVIACQGRPNGYARTLQIYQNHMLHAEWRFPAGSGNSGIFLHLTGADRVWATCLEVQLATGTAGEVRCNGGSRVQELTSASSISVPRRQPGSEKPVGEWNHCDIVWAESSGRWPTNWAGFCFTPVVRLVGCSF